MKENLLEGLTKEERESLKQQFANFKDIRNKIIKVLDTKVYINSKVEKKDFINLSWPYLRAWQDGYIKALKEVINLLGE